MSGLGLGGYSSSEDEAGEAPVTTHEGHNTLAQVTPDATNGSTAVVIAAEDEFQPDAGAVDSSLVGPSVTIGPALPAEMSPAASQTPQLPEADPSLSPYSRTRQQVRMLTMPPAPNFEIPPSPPPADPSETAVLNKKVRNFLELKQRGVHFNQRLLSSNALGNPAMASKLLDFAGIEGVVQYDHALPDGLGIDVRHWAGLRVEEIVAQMEAAQLQHDKSRKGRPRDFVASRGK